jgi:hypothetical protein
MRGTRSVLASPTAVAATVTGQYGRHADELLAGEKQPPGEPEPIAASVLDRDQPRLLEPCKPPAQLPETYRASRHLKTC